ncbi:MAG: helix-turn-helix domain-containing protein [Chthoniobacterales bacterium]
MRLQSKKPLPRVYPKQVVTIGDAIRKRRLDLRLLQKDVAARLGCDTDSVCHWEIGRSYPKICFFKPIVEFLGYSPFPVKDSIAGHLVNYRKIRGWTQKHFAAVIGIDQATLAKYERGERIPAGKYLKKIEGFIPPDVS